MCPPRSAAVACCRVSVRRINAPHRAARALPPAHTVYYYILVPLRMATTHPDTLELLRSAVAEGISYAQYRQTGDELFAARRSSPADTQDASDKMLEYVRLNIQRMNRLDKTISLNADIKAAIANLPYAVRFLLISEVWCGDAAQNVPLIAKMAAESEGKIQLHIVWRDLRPELIDAYLTRGGRAIPKLIILHADTLEPLANWGARPAASQVLVDEYKANPNGRTFDQFATELHAWYAQDKCVHLQAELAEILQQLPPKNQ